MRLVLADDHALFRDGLRNLLEAHGLEVIGEAANGREAVELVHRVQPDVVLMDIQMPVLSGIDATRLLSAELPDVRIVMLTASSDDADIFEAIKSGASGYISKDLEAERFIPLLEGVSRGEPALSPSVARKVLGEFARPAPRQQAIPGTELTERELEVLKQLVSGTTSNKDLAAALFISENTVKYHLRNILEKLHVSSRAQVIAYAMQHRLVDPGSTR
jgi:DNA-binding NarL/FixJ family response regulator